MITYIATFYSIAFFARITGSGQDKPLASTFFIRLSPFRVCVNYSVTEEVEQIVRVEPQGYVGIYHADEE